LKVGTIARRLANLALLVLPSAFSCWPASATEPSTEPILRIDPGEHVSAIRRIATDAAGHWLVTASDDKTARVWNLGNGHLVSTLRPPLGLGHQGKLFAVALSPDGQTVAVGGSLQFGNGEMDSNQIYLFDRSSGRILRRIGGLPSVVAHIAFSADGRYLGVSMGGTGGVQVLSAADGRLIAATRDHGGQSYSIDFSRDGRLVTTCTDGFLRLYRFEGEQLKSLATHAAPGGKEPVGARFSPDGHHIAVGFGDTPAVNIVDGYDLRFLYAPETNGLNNGSYAIAWSRDGAWLHAAGRFNRNNEHFIRRWPVHGHRTGTAQDWPVARNTILDLAATPEGRLIFAGANAQWGVVDASGRRSAVSDVPVVADFRGNLRGFTVSPDGSRVRFSYESEGKTPAVFYTLARRVLSGDTSGLIEPLFSAPGINVTDWSHSRAPKLNGVPIKLEALEMSRSLAHVPSGDGFVLGADWTLRSYTRDGTLRWLRFSPEVVWAVNISRDGRWVVAAYGDGTIRWHRSTDGSEQLAFYPHPDRKRWVLWTPSGYYDAAPGAEDLIGWHLNRGKDQSADFFPASRFRAQFYRPDILARVLEVADEKDAVEKANAEAGRRPQAAAIAQALPPVVEILSPNEGTKVDMPSVTLRYSTRSPADAPVTGLRARVNGLAVNLPEMRTLAVKPSEVGAARELTIRIPARDSEIQLFAENSNGVSVPAVLRVTWAGAASNPASRDEAQYKPKLYVLAVGVSKYANADFNLGLAAKDARDFAAVFQQQKGKLYADVQVRLLTDAKATKDDVLDGLEWLKREVTARDVGMVFLAGHGMNDNTGSYYFLPHNADPGKLLRTGVAQNDIKVTLNSLAGKAIFFVDTCHSGNALGTAKTRSINSQIDAFVNELASAENGVVVFTAATGKQFSQEDPAWGNGAFTKAVVEGLSGKADFQGTGKITHKGLDYYVTERVKTLTKGTQSPVSIAPQGVTDFPIVVLR